MQIIKKEEKKEKEKLTTQVDFVSHDLELMMPGSNLMITSGNQYGSVGGGMMPPPGPPGMGSPPGMVPPPVGMPPMGGFPPQNPPSPYQSRQPPY